MNLSLFPPDEHDAEKKISKLRKELKEHNYRYYTLAQPTISDFEFDQKLKELEALEKQWPQFADPDSPTRKVGGAVNREFRTVRHKRRMMSLGNTYSEEELREFDQRIFKAIGGETEYSCELKIDGLAISLHYENGKLVQAVTRGDGEQGDDVTDNVRTIRSLATQLHGDYPAAFEIRGEIFMHRAVFDRINKEREEAGETPYANPRNLASGTLKMQDSSEVAKRPLDICLYHLLTDNEEEFHDHYHALEKAKSWGLSVSPYNKKVKGIEEVIRFIHDWDQKRHDLSFDTDGVVIKVNDIRQQHKLGFTAKEPRWAIAYKYQTESALTTLNSVSYQVGRTGAVTPVANLEPVLLLGTTVKRASLYNESEIQRLGLHIGDRVFIEKGGEIIPKVTAVEHHSRKAGATAVKFITHCPECGTELVKKSGDAIWYCPNSEQCPPQILGKIEHFVARKAMDIDSIGAEVIDLLNKYHLVRNVADLYDLREESFEPVKQGESWKTDRSGFVSNILSGIAASKQVPFERVLFALGIRHVGETVAKKLARHFGDIDRLSTAETEELLQVPEIGQVIAESVRDWFSNPRNREIVSRLQVHGLQFESHVKQNTEGVLSGKSVVISGTFSKYSRDQLKELIEQHGGRNTGSVSGSTDYLLAGAEMGPAKLEKAQKLGVKIISEDEFLEMIGLG